MRVRTYVPLLLLVSAATTVMLAHGKSPTEKVANTDQFLQSGDSYVVQFLRGRAPHYTSGHDPSPLDSDDGVQEPSQARVSWTSYLTIYRVIRQQGPSWVLVEYPVSPKDYDRWEGKHRAQFRLRNPASLMSEMNDAQRASAKSAASQEIEVKQAWLNIGHAISIQPLSINSLWSP
ncbi:hypothetical protein SH528x_002970 [Novipirellula sp. SH528]|uniref:hypothetical protein n=1 Tax=Novipirellula sp. SH528 TaxID=3454466 RepID=UPI003FA175C5